MGPLCFQTLTEYTLASSDKEYHLPKQISPLTPRVKPGGHSHWKLPTVLIHRPFLHGPDAHSSKSVR